MAHHARSHDWSPQSKFRPLALYLRLNLGLEYVYRIKIPLHLESTLSEFSAVRPECWLWLKTCLRSRVVSSWWGRVALHYCTGVLPSSFDVLPFHCVNHYSIGPLIIYGGLGPYEGHGFLIGEGSGFDIIYELAISWIHESVTRWPHYCIK